MSGSAARTITIRLALEDGNVREKLEALGKSGPVSLQQIERAAAGAAANADNLARSTERATNSIGLQGYQVRNLTAQFVDLGTQLASGGGIFLPLIQQGPQAVDAVGGVGAALRILGQVLTPTVLGVAAVATGLGVAVIATEAADRAVQGLSQRLRATRTDYADLARTIEANARVLAGSTDLSTADARQAGLAIASARNFSGTSADLLRLTQQSQDLAKAMGIAVPEASKRMADALNAPAEAARTLAREGLTTMTDALRRTVEQLEASGQSGEASRLVLDAMARATAGAAQAQTPLQQALSGVSQAATRLWNDLKPVLEPIGRTVLDGIVIGINLMRDAINGLRDAGAAAGQAFGWYQALLDGSNQLGARVGRAFDTDGLGSALGLGPGANANPTGARGDAPDYITAGIRARAALDPNAPDYVSSCNASTTGSPHGLSPAAVSFRRRMSSCEASTLAPTPCGWRRVGQECWKAR